MKKILLTGFFILASSINLAHAEGYNYGVDLGSFKGKSYSPYAKRNFPTRPLWGDTHLHTKLSLDARNAGVLLS